LVGWLAGRLFGWLFAWSLSHYRVDGMMTSLLAASKYFLVKVNGEMM